MNLPCFENLACVEVGTTVAGGAVIVAASTIALPARDYAAHGIALAMRGGQYVIGTYRLNSRALVSTQPCKNFHEAAQTFEQRVHEAGLRIA